MYIELSFGIFLITVILNNALGIDAYINPKWLALLTSLFGAAIHWFTHPVTDPFKLLTSLGIALVIYTYLYKPIKKICAGKNPLL